MGDTDESRNLRNGAIARLCCTYSSGSSMGRPIAAPYKKTATEDADGEDLQLTSISPFYLKSGTFCG